MAITSWVFWSFVAIGVASLVLQRLALARHRRGAASAPVARAPISVLKPLCGVDDGLADTLEQFARQQYPQWELLLGLEHPDDPAAAIAHAAARRWPDRIRVVLQRSAPGLNPKVNQLITLAAEARHDWLVVSDSNVRVGPDYLAQIAEGFADPKVGCVAHPVSGQGHQSFGALLDNFHLAASVGASQIAAKRLFGRDLVVGKAMALRREVLESIGGFSAYADVLAEDYEIGRELARREVQIVLARSPVFNWATRRTVRSFIARYRRWGVIHRTAVTLPTSFAQGLLNPVPFALIAASLQPSLRSLAAVLLTFAVKASLDLSAASALGCRVSGPRAVLAVGVKDALIFVAWLNGFFERKVSWRGHWLQVTAGSKLVRPARPLEEAPEASQ